MAADRGLIFPSQVFTEEPWMSGDESLDFYETLDSGFRIHQRHGIFREEAQDWASVDPMAAGPS